MPRLMTALREWLEIRARVREEREFHLERAAEDYRESGLTGRAARGKARARFGGRGSSRIALRELGGDWSGLARLVGAHRVLAPAWVQPVVLLVAIAMVSALSPARREIVDAMIVRVRQVQHPGEVELSVEGRSPWSGGGISGREFAALRSMATLKDAGRYEGLYARARIVGSARLDEVQAEVRARTGEPFVARPMGDRIDIAAGPAQIVWMAIGVYGLALLMRHWRGAAIRRWVCYGIGVGCLHAAASMAAYALAIQVRLGGAGIAVVFGALLIGAGMQCRWWWSDLRQRCPVCLERMVMPLREGAEDRVLLGPAVTESVCVHGHGVLVESRWVRRFRAEESSLEQLV